MSIAVASFKNLDHMDFIKIRWQKYPNEDYRNGLGFMLFNACFCIYWGKIA